MHSAFGGARLFGSNFNPRKLRSISGPLGQQMEVTEGPLKPATYFATYFGVHSFAYEGLGKAGGGVPLTSDLEMLSSAIIADGAFRKFSDRV